MEPVKCPDPDDKDSCECPDKLDADNCADPSLSEGDYCRARGGQCGTDEKLDNCKIGSKTYDVYRVAVKTPQPTLQPTLQPTALQPTYKPSSKPVETSNPTVTGHTPCVDSPNWSASAW